MLFTSVILSGAGAQANPGPPNTRDFRVMGWDGVVEGSRGCWL